MLLLPLAVPAPASPLSSLQPLLELSPRALPLLLLLPMVLLTWLTVELCVDIISLAYACTMAIACPQSSQRRRAVASRTRTLKGNTHSAQRVEAPDSILDKRNASRDALVLGRAPRRALGPHTHARLTLPTRRTCNRRWP
jgi:hypothetical protein